MITGTVGIPLLWPFQIAFYLAQIRPKSVGELIMGIVIATLLLAPQAPTVTATIRNVAPQEEITFLPSPTPHTVTILIENVYSVESEILISQGDWLNHGDMIANLTTLRRMTAINPTSTPRLPHPPPLQPPPHLPTHHGRQPPSTPLTSHRPEQDLSWRLPSISGPSPPAHPTRSMSLPSPVFRPKSKIGKIASHERDTLDTGYQCNQELEQLLQQQARFATLAAP